MKRSRFLSLVCFSIFMGFSVYSFSTIPLQINHQGAIKISGVAYDGSGDFYFALVEGSTGHNLWTNDGSQLGTTSQPSSAVALSVTQGLYSVNLGDTTLTNMVAIPSTVFNTDDVKLRIWLDDGSGAVQLSPDLTMTSAPYAFQAASAVESTTSAVALDAQQLGGMGPSGYATDIELSSGLAGKANSADVYTQTEVDNALSGKSDTGHGHNLQDLSGAVTDAQVPDDITITETDTLDTVTGRGASTTNGITVGTVDTGQGANELYAMDQNVQTTDEVIFAKGTFTVGGAVLDQENFPATIYFGLPAGSWGAQVFTAGMTGLLTKVTITVGHQGTAGDINISIYSGDTPDTGTLISSVETTTISTHYSSLLNYELELSTPAPVTATQKYYIFYEPQTQNLSIGGQTSDSYPGGNLWSSGSSYASYDYAFETYVQSVTDVLDVQGFAAMADTTNPPSTTTDRLYNNGGNLFWDGNQVVTADNVSVNKDEINNSGALGFQWSDAEVSDNLTVTGMATLTGTETLTNKTLTDPTVNAGGGSIVLPQGTDVSGNTAEGQVSWDSDDDKLYVGDGSSTVEIGAGGGGSSMDASTTDGEVKVNVGSSYTTVTSKTYNAPANGTALILVTGYTQYAGGTTPTELDEVEIGIATTNNGSPVNTPVRSAPYQADSFTVQYLTSVSAGNNSFYLVGRSGNNAVDYNVAVTQFTVLFF